MKTTTQLTVAAVALFTFSFISVGSLYHLIDRMSDDGRVVNHTGIVRGASQRLVKLELAGEKNDESIRRVERIIGGLIDGDRALQLPPATDAEFLAKMQAVESGWERLKETILTVRGNPTQRDRLLAQSEEFFKLTNAAVFAAEDFAKGKVEFTKTSQLVLFGLNLLVLTAICLVTRTIQDKLKKTIGAIAASSTEIAAVVTQQEAVASMQASSVHQTTATTTHLNESSELSALQAEAANAAAARVMNLALDGSQTVAEMVEEMQKLQAQGQAIADKIDQLKERTSRIEDISHLVSHLANQTNVLALNAAVEAKRAGIDGKGFSVVAGEIRKLASHSNKSATEIKNLVSELQNAMNATVEVTREGTQQMEEGVQRIEGMAAGFQSVVYAIDEVLISSEEISRSAREQAIAIQQVFAAMNAINNGAKETANGISQTKIGTQQLQEAALALKTIV